MVKYREQKIINPGALKSEAHPGTTSTNIQGFRKCSI